MKHVQSRCPGTSLNDWKHLEDLVHNKQIFSKVDDATRQEIWTRLRDIKYLIPTLGSLQHDFKYIRGPALALCKLLSPKRSRRQRRKTLRELAGLAFPTSQTHQKVTIQITDDSTQEIVCNANDQFEISFQQLYLFAMRESWNLVDDCPLKERARGKPLARSPDPIAWHNFAKLAYNLGFESSEIQRLMQMNPFGAKARQVLLDQKGWHSEDALIQRLLNDTERLYRIRSNNPSTQQNEPEMLTDGPGEPVYKRQGRRYENACNRDKQHMFLKILFQPVHGRAVSVTSLFVRKSVHQAFFPTWNITYGASIVSEPEEEANCSRTGEQTNDVDMTDDAISNWKEHTDGFMARNQQGDVDMTDIAAVSRSSQGDDANRLPYLHAGPTKKPQKATLSSNREVRDDLANVPNTVSTGAINESPPKMSTFHFGIPASALPSARPLALQLVSATDARLSVGKRTRTDDVIEKIRDRNGSEITSGAQTQALAKRGSASSDTPANALTPATSLDPQLLSASHIDIWARKRPRTGDILENFEGRNGNEHENGLTHLPSGNNGAVRPPTLSQITPLVLPEEHIQNSSPAEVTVWTDFNGPWQKLENIRCNSSEQVQEVIADLQAHRKCWPGTMERRGLMASECYEWATQPGGDYCVYVTDWEEM